MKARKSARPEKRGKAPGGRATGPPPLRLPAPHGCGTLPAGCPGRAFLSRQPCPGTGNVRHTLRRRPGRETRPPGSAAEGSARAPASLPKSRKEKADLGKALPEQGAETRAAHAGALHRPRRKARPARGNKGFMLFPRQAPQRTCEAGKTKPRGGRLAPEGPATGESARGPRDGPPSPAPPCPRHRAAGATQYTESTRPRSSRRKARPWRPCALSPCPNSPSCRWW